MLTGEETGLERGFITFPQSVGCSDVSICEPMDCSPPGSMEFSRQEYWSGLPFFSSEDLPDPGIEPGPLTLWVDSLPCEPPGKPSFPKITQLVSDNTKLKTH